MLNHDSLKGMILPKISLDVYESKLGRNEDYIVVAFYSLDQGPADDLDLFIQRGYIDVEDVEVSPTTDTNGNYIIFVEMDRDKNFKNQFYELIRDVENVTGKLDWEVKPYLSNDVFDYKDPVLFDYVILDRKDYVTKKDFIKKTMNESISEFFEASVARLTICKENVILALKPYKISGDVVDQGLLEEVLTRNKLNESAFKLAESKFEVDILRNMLGESYSIAAIDEFILIEKNNKEILLLKNVETLYGNLNV